MSRSSSGGSSGNLSSGSPPSRGVKRRDPKASYHVKHVATESMQPENQAPTNAAFPAPLPGVQVTPPSIAPHAGVGSVSRVFSQPLGAGLSYIKQVNAAPAGGLSLSRSPPDSTMSRNSSNGVPPSATEQRSPREPATATAPKELLEEAARKTPPAAAPVPACNPSSTWMTWPPLSSGSASPDDLVKCAKRVDKSKRR